MKLPSSDPLVLSPWRTKDSETESERGASIRIQFDKIMKYGGVCVAEMVGCSAVSISTKRDEISHVQLYPGDLSERGVIDPSPKGRAEISELK